MRPAPDRDRAEAPPALREDLERPGRVASTIVVPSAIRLGLPAFIFTVVLSGFEQENLGAGIAANARIYPGCRPGPSYRGGAASGDSVAPTAGTACQLVERDGVD